MIENLDEIPEKIATVLRKHGVLKAAVFGSFARGEAKDSSDLDLLVEMTDEKSLLDVIALRQDLEDAVGRDVDLVEYSMIHPRLRDRILREQVPVI